MSFFGDYRTLRFKQTKKGGAWDTPDEQSPRRAELAELQIEY